MLHFIEVDPNDMTQRWGAYTNSHDYSGHPKTSRYATRTWFTDFSKCNILCNICNIFYVTYVTYATFSKYAQKTLSGLRERLSEVSKWLVSQFRWFLETFVFGPYCIVVKVSSLSGCST